ncbi:MAG TPA: FtsX-like permease family protein [Vicinamibacterales bacterium]|nr:FtsX-like permease family protein [Vicinamibacterales bacterium]
MKYGPLVWRSLVRRKTRAVFTVLSILVAFLLFGVLAALNTAFTAGVELAGNDRLVVTHKVSIIQMLPESYTARLEATAGVVDVLHETYFGGIYQKPSNFFMQCPVVPGRLLRLYPEYRLPEDQRRAWLTDRTCAIAGRQTADRFGWKVGDRIPIQATIWTKRDGGRSWEFNLCGIYDADQGVDTTQFFFNYDYFDESRSFWQGQVGWYVIRIGDPADAAALARRIDEQFANSPAETKTATEKAFVQAFARQIGDIGLIIRVIVTAVFFTILLVAANTMAQSVRERTSELAVLKTLGYSDGLVLALVMAESCAMAVSGGAAGLGLAWLLTRAGDPTGGLFPAWFLSRADLARGGFLALALGLVAGVVPALQAMRLRIVDALRRA